MRVDLGLVVTPSVQKRLRQAALAIAWLGFLLFSAPAVLGGEKIKIDQATNDINLPQDIEKERLSPDALGSKISPGESRQGPILPMPNQPVYLKNPKLDELLDRKKNWIMNSPGNLDRDKSLNEIFGVKDYDFSKSHQKSKSSMERIFDAEADTDKKVSKSSNRSPDDEDTREGLNKRSEGDPRGRSKTPEDNLKSETPGIIPALNPAPLFNWDASPDGLNQAGDLFGRKSILPPGLGDPIFGARTATVQPIRDNNNTPGQRDFERGWDLRKMPLRGLNDPINGQFDNRFGISPLGGRKAVPVLTEPIAGGPAASPSGFGNGASIPLPRSDLMGPSRSLPTPASFAPVSGSPVSTPVITPKPAVLEIPRPKF